MSQGTISVLFGCHSIVIHPIMVIIAWYKLNKKLPEAWQLVCIFLHDIGHLGLDYLDDVEQKRRHWHLGAWLAFRLFGEKGYRFTAGHCEYSGWVFSQLYYADKASWHYAPRIWLYSNTFFEPKLAMGYKRWEAVLKFKAQVKASIDNNRFTSTHEMYLNRCNGKGKP